MSQIRTNFLNWMPDAEDTATQGLTVADNVVHETEGYKLIGLGSAGSFSTTGNLGASVATVEACAARPVGDGADYFCAWIANSTLHAVSYTHLTLPTITE